VFNSRYIGFNQPPILASIAYLDSRANMWELGEEESIESGAPDAS